MILKLHFLTMVVIKLSSQVPRKYRAFEWDVSCRRVLLPWLNHNPWNIFSTLPVLDFLSKKYLIWQNLWCKCEYGNSKGIHCSLPPLICIFVDGARCWRVRVRGNHNDVPNLCKESQILNYGHDGVWKPYIVCDSINHSTSVTSITIFHPLSPRYSLWIWVVRFMVLKALSITLVTVDIQRRLSDL